MIAFTPRAAIDGFVAAMRAKDLDGMLRLVADDIFLIGSEGHEVAHGRDEVRALLADVMRAEASYAWDLSGAQVQEGGDVAWFAVDTALEARFAGGVKRRPYRVSGVLVRGPDGAWRWWHFHGSEPAGPTNEQEGVTARQNE